MNKRKHNVGKMAKVMLMAAALMETSVVNAAGVIQQTGIQAGNPQPMTLPVRISGDNEGGES